MFNWGGDLIWEYQMVNSTRALNHDFVVLPNGNILLTIFEVPTVDELIEVGCNLDSVDYVEEFLTISLIEIEPIYPNDVKVVWEWKEWDHLIQDYNSTKLNYGVISDHPELIDINYREESGQGGADSMHANAIDYNEELDQILLSVRAFDEIWIIDHSTTTEEAAGHSGGRYGMGGDIIYRWGNPLAYKRGTEEDHMIYKHHDARWIDKGCPGEGNIIFFNNGFCRPNKLYSNVLEIKPPMDEDGRYILGDDLIYGPKNVEWEYNSEQNTRFYSERFSTAQRLDNGNTLILLGEPAKMIIVNSENEIIWRYKNAFTLPFSIYDDVYIVNYYKKDYPGLKEFNAGSKPIMKFLNNHPFLFPIIRTLLSIIG